MLNRLVQSLGIILAGLVFYLVVNRIILFNAGIKSRELPFKLNGKPIILYFTTPDCLPCKTIQRPALRKLKHTIGENNLQIVEVDATEEAQLANQWGVVSVPTTFMIDPQGKLKYVNHGVAREEKLLKQLENLSKV